MESLPSCLDKYSFLELKIFYFLFFLQDNKPLEPDNNVVFQDILLIGQVCFESVFLNSTANNMNMLDGSSCAVLSLSDGRAPNVKFGSIKVMKSNLPYQYSQKI